MERSLSIDDSSVFYKKKNCNTPLRIGIDVGRQLQPFSQKNCYVRYQLFSFVVWVVEGSIKKRRKKWRLSFKKIGDDVIAQKAVTSFKQVARHRMTFFKIKSTCPSDFLKNITLRYYEFCSKLYVQTV
jgi:hypothetical protein